MYRIGGRQRYGVVSYTHLDVYKRQEVKQAMIRNGAVYFAAVGGAGALLARAIVKSEVIAYEDLGTEAIRRLEIKDFPVIVVMDSQGNNLYETELIKYRRDEAILR